MAQTAFFGGLNVLYIILMVTTVISLFNPLNWVNLATAILQAFANLFGFWAVLRLIPEWMVGYCYFVIFLIVPEILVFIFGFFTNGITFGIFRFVMTLLLTASLVLNMSAMRNYALTCRNSPYGV
ncbi:hypothetical protein HDV05_003839 [Chytridiales sp. JEL 0842]|nr:hypothetical protein HDV05_003839 [Chytridiales sp. JEL 0842]